MQFRSTNSQELQVSFKDAVLRCLPQDNGLYVPSKVMDLRQFFLYMGEETAYPDLVSAVAPILLEGALNPLSAARVTESAFDFEPELVQLDEKFSVLKLHNGPTGTFRDFGVAFLAAVLEELLKNNPKAMIVSSARGDSGIILEKAFRDRIGLTSVLLFPSGQIHGLDRDYYVPNGGNTIPIQVKGTLDDCHRLVREIINDRPFAERYRITSANGINPGRLLPQAFYFLYAFIKIKSRLAGDLFFSVPTENFGNLISGLYAWKFGLPVNGFIAAMNANDNFGRFIQSGKFKMRPLSEVKSPAPDIIIPSNYERLISFYEEAPAVMRNMIFPALVDDVAIRKGMELAWKKYGIILDSHAAASFAAAGDLINMDNYSNAHVIMLDTDHPALQADLVESCTGQKIPLPEKLAMFKNSAEPIAVIDPQIEALEGAIASCF